MGCAESKSDLQIIEKYATQLKNASVTAVMDVLALDRRSVGLKFYKVFAAMDIDGSNSIDLNEIHCYFGLPRTAFSDQVFSGLGKQTPSSSDVTFDCFVMNIWNFCTMTPTDLFTHVFNIYDDDRSGTLDAAECDSLFRLLYHTDELSPAIKQVVQSVDANGDGLLSLDEFLTLCERHRALMSPIFKLQSKARDKCLGAPFWAKESKRRPTLLARHKDIFSYTQQQQPSLLPHNTKADAAPTSKTPVFEAVVTPAAQPKASERLAAKQQQQAKKELEQWVEEHQEQPPIHAYLVAFSDKFVKNTRLQRLLDATGSRTDAVGEITELRHSCAVSAKKFDAAKATMVDLWNAEQQHMIERRHEAVRGMVKGVSAKTLLKQAGKQSAASAVGNYLQKKLDEAEQDVQRQVQERWATLDRAAAMLAQGDLEAFDAASTRAPIGALFAKQERASVVTIGLERTKIVPINDETWSEFWDEAHGRYYYVSSLGYSSWDRPDALAGLSARDRSLVLNKANHGNADSCDSLSSPLLSDADRIEHGDDASAARDSPSNSASSPMAFTTGAGIIESAYWRHLRWRWRVKRRVRSVFASDASVAVKALSVPHAALVFVRDVTIPLLDDDAWSRPLATLSPITVPLFVLLTAGSLGDCVFPDSRYSTPLWQLALAGGAVAAVAVNCCTHRSHAPTATGASLVFLALAFASCVCWIYAVANELMALLIAVGVITRASNSLLGLTVLAWGNSVGDLITNVSVARAGFPQMAIAGCYGGPVFNILLGLGVPMAVALARGDALALELDAHAVVSLGFLVASLAASAVVFQRHGFHCPAWYGRLLVLYYALYTAVNVAMALHAYVASPSSRSA